ncbi:DNA repair helicase rad5,16 [Fonsecaea pedrosoi]|nr:DNA repair helicase rad5,16 [Fonsecaea pedrosoi]
MAQSPGSSVAPDKDVIVISDDSDSDSGSECQLVVPEKPRVKAEPDEEANKTFPVDSNTSQNEITATSHDNGFDDKPLATFTSTTTKSELAELFHEQNDTTSHESNDDEEDIKPDKPNSNSGPIMLIERNDGQKDTPVAQTTIENLDRVAEDAGSHHDGDANDKIHSGKQGLAERKVEDGHTDVDLVKAADDGSNVPQPHVTQLTRPESFDEYKTLGHPEQVDLGGPSEPPFPPEEDLEMHGLEALQQYNQNKTNLRDLEDGDDAIDESAWNSAGLSNNLVEENSDEMDWNAVIDKDPAAEDAQAAAYFAHRKAEYEKKVAAKTNTKADDMLFATEKLAEHRRLRDIARRKLVVNNTPTRDDLPAGYEEADSLFVPEIPTLPGPPPKEGPAPKTRNRLSKKELQDAISAGIDAGFGEGRKPKRKAAASTEDRQPRKKRGTNQNGGVPKSYKKRSQPRRPNLSNLQSLGQTNIVGAAQANASRPDMPTFTSSNKATALKELIASIPSAERGSANSDRAAVLEATKKFKGRGAVRSDNHGGWKLRGMESSLYNHQLLGAAFMRERETGEIKPKGGLVCDEMGFGKTIQMIANILDGKADEGSAIKTTLIIAPPTLLNQWMQEMDKHVKGNAMGRILRFHSGSRLQSNNIVADLTAYDVILTTYGEVQKSYPLAEPPKNLASEEQKNKWWKDYFLNNVGPLHRIKFHRIVLDEAHHIKNHTSKTSIAVRALTGIYRWCITGTPILNYIEELFPYFSFLRVPHTGDYATFCHNYCNNRINKDPVNMGRLHNVLRGIMLRRTHVDTLFNAPIVKLPGITHNTILVEFNAVERNIYNIVKSRYIQRINTYSTSGNLNSNYGNILGMLMRLRMLCSHIMLCQDVLKRLFVAADIETLWRLAAKEVSASRDNVAVNMMRALRKMLIANENTLKTFQTRELEGANVTPDVEDDENLATGSDYGLSFQFRKFLRALATSETWTEVHLRSICAKCRQPPDEPVCTSCFHVYCQECMTAMHEERTKRGEEKMACLECQTFFEESSPCSGLKELGFNNQEMAAKVEKKKRRLAKLTQKATGGARGAGFRHGSDTLDDNSEGEEEDLDWLEAGGDLLPSAKLLAAKAAILNWKKRDEGQKVLVYTQFLGLGKIFSKVCSAEGWGHVLFNGKMSLDARDRAITKFQHDPNIFIMICSLKAGGVGLNLSMASKVIILDLWFNSSVEAQAYCRAFRIGQENRVDVLRFVVKGSIDEDLIRMQERKDVEVTGAIGPDSMGKRATIQQLLELFGEVKEQGQNEFILVEDENDGQDDGDGDNVDLTHRLPPRPF